MYNSGYKVLKSKVDETQIIVFFILRKTTVLPSCMFETIVWVSVTVFYVSFIHSRIMYVVPREKAWKDDSNHTKYSKLPWINLCGFRNKDDISLHIFSFLGTILYNLCYIEVTLWLPSIKACYQYTRLYLPCEPHWFYSQSIFWL